MVDKIKKSPQIRFKGYTEDWEQRQVSCFGNKTFGGGTPKTSVEEYWDGNLPWIQSSDLTEDVLEIKEPRKKITEEAVKNSATKIVPENSIAVVTRVGVGKLALMQIPYATSQDFLSISDLNLNEWFATYALYNLLQKEKKAVQGTSIKGITKEDLLMKNVMIPESQDEQRLIGEYFYKLDNLITLHQRKLELLKDTKKSMLQKMFPKNGETVPEVRFAGFTDAWEQRRLETVIDLKSGRDYKHLSDGDIPVYGTGGYMLSVNEALSTNEDAIGIGRKGSIDKPYILRAPFWTVDTLFYAIPKKSNDLQFTYCIFQNVNWKSKDESTGVPSLSKTTINSVQLKVPSFSEQQKIGTYFSKLDETITLHQREVDLLRDLKKAMLQQMFI